MPTDNTIYYLYTKKAEADLTELLGLGPNDHGYGLGRLFLYTRLEPSTKTYLEASEDIGVIPESNVPIGYGLWDYHFPLDGWAKGVDPSPPPPPPQEPASQARANATAGPVVRITSLGTSRKSSRGLG